MKARKRLAVSPHSVAVKDIAGECYLLTFPHWSERGKGKRQAVIHMSFAAADDLSRSIRRAVLKHAVNVRNQAAEKTATANYLERPMP